MHRIIGRVVATWLLGGVATVASGRPMLLDRHPERVVSMGANNRTDVDEYATVKDHGGSSMRSTAFDRRHPFPFARGPCSFIVRRA